MIWKVQSRKQQVERDKQRGLENQIENLDNQTGLKNCYFSSVYWGFFKKSGKMKGITKLW